MEGGRGGGGGGREREGGLEVGRVGGGNDGTEGGREGKVGRKSNTSVSCLVTSSAPFSSVKSGCSWYTLASDSTPCRAFSCRPSSPSIAWIFFSRLARRRSAFIVLLRSSSCRHDVSV